MTGVEGVFRGSCEQVLSLARRQGTPLTEVLQAILTDPLLDWIPGEEQDSVQKVQHLFSAASTVLSVPLCPALPLIL